MSSYWLWYFSCTNTPVDKPGGFLVSEKRKRDVDEEDDEEELMEKKEKKEKKKTKGEKSEKEEVSKKEGTDEEPRKEGKKKQQMPQAEGLSQLWKKVEALSMAVFFFILCFVICMESMSNVDKVVVLLVRVVSCKYVLRKEVKIDKRNETVCSTSRLLDMEPLPQMVSIFMLRSFGSEGSLSLAYPAIKTGTVLWFWGTLDGLP